jgi:hypothetical protein
MSKLQTRLAQRTLCSSDSCAGNCVDYSASHGSGVPNLTPPTPSASTSNSAMPPLALGPPAIHIDIQSQQQQQQQQSPLPPPSVSSSPPGAPTPQPVTINKNITCGSLPLGCDIPNEFVVMTHVLQLFIARTSLSLSDFASSLLTLLSASDVISSTPPPACRATSAGPTLHLGRGTLQRCAMYCSATGRQCIWVRRARD